MVETQKKLRDVMKVADLSTGKMENLMPPLTDQEEEMFRNMMRRLHTVFKVNHLKLYNSRLVKLMYVLITGCNKNGCESDGGCRTNLFSASNFKNRNGNDENLQ